MINTMREISIGAGRVLKATPVLDTYWRFAQARQEILVLSCSAVRRGPKARTATACKSFGRCVRTVRTAPSDEHSEERAGRTHRPPPPAEYSYEGSQRNSWRARTRPPASRASTTQSPSAPGASVLWLWVRQFALPIGRLTAATMRPW